MFEIHSKQNLCKFGFVYVVIHIGGTLRMTEPKCWVLYSGKQKLIMLIASFDG